MSATGNAVAPFASDFLDMMNSVVTIQAYVANSDPYNLNETLGPSYPAQAYVAYKNHYVRGSQGELVAARGTIYIATSNMITVGDKITLPDGTAPIILNVGALTDETGAVVVMQVDFG